MLLLLGATCSDSTSFFYHGRRDFDRKGYATQTLGLEIFPSDALHLEDIWKDYKDEEEVLQRDHTRLTLKQIKSFNLKFNVEGIVDDGSNMEEPGWKESNELKFLAVDWHKEEDDNVNRRMRFILTYR